MTDIDSEIELFEEETADVVEFSESILSQLPEDSVHRLEASREIQKAIDAICDQFIAGASDLLTLGCERCLRNAVDCINPILHVRALRCAASERIWRACLEQLQCFCDDSERAELGNVLADEEYESSFAEYEECYLDCKQAVYRTFAQTTAVLKESKLILEHAESKELRNDIISREINHLDNKLIAAASRCDELLDDIYLIEEKTEETEKKATLRYNTNTCEQKSLKPKINQRLLTLKQTVALINEFWSAKSKNDASCRKEGRSVDTARQFLSSFYACKIGVGNTRSKQPKQLAYSAGYYTKESAICAIFCAEIQGDIDEAFKLMGLEQERRVSQIAHLYLNKLCDEKEVSKFALSKGQMLEIASRSYEVTGIDPERIIIDLYADSNTSTLHDFLNLVDLESLRIHREKLERLSEAFKFYDSRKVQRLNRDNFVELVRENFPESNAEKLFEQASEGHADITFSESVFVLGPVLFADHSQSEQPAQVSAIEHSEGLRINDLK